MADARPILKVVNPDTGELDDVDECPDCKELDRELRRQRTVIANLRRDRDAEARSDPLWGLAVALYTEWKVAADHTRSQWTADRFFLCRPYLAHDGFHVCRFAVWGIAAAPNTRRITSAYEERYDDWETLFKNRATFERYAKRGRALFADQLPIPPDEAAVNESLRIHHRGAEGS